MTNNLLLRAILVKQYGGQAKLKCCRMSVQISQIGKDNRVEGGAGLYYKIHYSCCSHIGKRRTINQDNFVCDKKYMSPNKEPLIFPLTGTLTNEQTSLIGVFDGMGGEECGEIASLIAAQCAAETITSGETLNDLENFCTTANNKICEYAFQNNVSSMGTTAALLAFSEREIMLCNIGDSKIFRYADKKLEQISVDHYSIAAYGMKPPLSQNLGIPPSEMVIEPHMAKGAYNDEDVYLLCSDGLTDMVAEKDIAQVLSKTSFDECASELLHMALENGGKDNITIILCKVERERQNLFGKLFRLH